MPHLNGRHHWVTILDQMCRSERVPQSVALDRGHLDSELSAEHRGHLDFELSANFPSDRGPPKFRALPGAAQRSWAPMFGALRRSSQGIVDT